MRSATLTLALLLSSAGCAPKDVRVGNESMSDAVQQEADLLVDVAPLGPRGALGGPCYYELNDAGQIKQMSCNAGLLCRPDYVCYELIDCTPGVCVNRHDPTLVQGTCGRGVECVDLDFDCRLLVSCVDNPQCPHFKCGY